MNIRAADLPEHLQHLLHGKMMVEPVRAGAVHVVAAPPRRNKYGAQRVEVDGIRFDSKREAHHYQALKAAIQDGTVKWFIRQVPFRLPGGTVWRADFLVVFINGDTAIQDVKGYKTATYRVKKREVEAHYGITIVEI